VENTVGTIETFWGHQLIPEDLYTEWKEQCGYSKDYSTYTSSACTQLQDRMWMLVSNVDPYALVRLPAHDNSFHEGSHADHAALCDRITRCVREMRRARLRG
jgi:hypothetical protein